MNTPSKEVLAPITADEISAWRKDAESYRLRADDAGRLAERMLRLLSEREPVGDGEVARFLQPTSYFDHKDAIAIIRRLARQCAEQKALLAGIWPAVAKEGYLIAVDKHGYPELEWIARRDALLNQEGG